MTRAYLDDYLATGKETRFRFYLARARRLTENDASWHRFRNHLDDRNNDDDDDNNDDDDDNDDDDQKYPSIYKWFTL